MYKYLSWYFLICTQVYAENIECVFYAQSILYHFLCNLFPLIGRTTDFCKSSQSSRISDGCGFLEWAAASACDVFSRYNNKGVSCSAFTLMILWMVVLYDTLCLCLRLNIAVLPKQFTICIYTVFLLPLSLFLYNSYSISITISVSITISISVSVSVSISISLRDATAALRIPDDHHLLRDRRICRRSTNKSNKYM